MIHPLLTGFDETTCAGYPSYVNLCDQAGGVIPGSARVGSGFPPPHRENTELMKRFCLLLIPAALLVLFFVSGCKQDTKPAITRLTLTPLCGVMPLQIEGYVAVSGGNETGNATGGTNNLEISWTFGDGHIGTTSRAFNTYADAGDFNVVVTATDPDGNSASSSMPVRVLADSLLVEASSNFPAGSVTTADTVQFDLRAESCDIDPDNAGNYAKIFFKWRMNDAAGTVFTGRAPRFRFTESGEYDVTLAVNYPFWAVVRRDTLHISVTDAP